MRRMSSVKMLAGAMLLAAFMPANVTRAQQGGAVRSEPYDIKRLGLGTRATVVVAVAAENCRSCIDSISFYKRLLRLPGMDGTTRRIVVVAMDGLWPVKDLTDKQSFEPHRLTSGPYPARRLPGVTKAPTILVLDEKGTQLGKWEGALSEEQKKEIIAAASRR